MFCLVTPIAWHVANVDRRRRRRQWRRRGGGSGGGGSGGGGGWMLAEEAQRLLGCRQHLRMLTVAGAAAETGL